MTTITITLPIDQADLIEREAYARGFAAATKFYDIAFYCGVTVGFAAGGLLGLLVFAR